MILCIESIVEEIRQWLPNPGIYGGIPVHVLPDAAFTGMTDEDGNPANFVGVEREFYPQFVEHWDALKAGTKTIKEIENEIRATGRWNGWHPLPEIKFKPKQPICRWY